MKVDNVNLKEHAQQVAETQNEGPSEGGFVECLLKMWKLRTKIVKAGAKILATGQFTEKTHRFVDFIYQNKALSIQAISSDLFQIKENN